MADPTRGPSREHGPEIADEVRAGLVRVAAASVPDRPGRDPRRGGDRLRPAGLGRFYVRAVADGPIGHPGDRRADGRRGVRPMGRRASAMVGPKPRTAVEIEGRFPQLGQRLRTVVQFAGLGDEAIVSEGVAPGLVEALNDETDARIEPMPIDAIVPVRRAWAVAAIAALPVALMAIAAIRSGEWRVAIQRTFLIERPYTTVVVRPGSVLVEQGVGLNVVAEVEGRMRPKVVLESRPAVEQRLRAWKSIAARRARGGSEVAARDESREDQGPVRVPACVAGSATERVVHDRRPLSPGDQGDRRHPDPAELHRAGAIDRQGGRRPGRRGDRRDVRDHLRRPADRGRDGDHRPGDRRRPGEGTPKPAPTIVPAQARRRSGS